MQRKKAIELLDQEKAENAAGLTWAGQALRKHADRMQKEKAEKTTVLTQQKRPTEEAVLEEKAARKAAKKAAKQAEAEKAQSAKTEKEEDAEKTAQEDKRRKKMERRRLQMRWP